MRLEFHAVEGGFWGKDDPMSFCLSCVVAGRDPAGAEHWMDFQRGYEDEDPAEDTGVYFGFDDQINGAYNCVQKCRLSRASIEVELTRPIDRRKMYTGVVVDISGLDDASFEAIRAGLPRIFRDTEQTLEVV
jgi:hypothetical protein